MSLQDVFYKQILAFHAAIIDNCDRATDNLQTDAMVLRLRDNAHALARLQLAMLALSDEKGRLSATDDKGRLSATDDKGRLSAGQSDAEPENDEPEYGEPLALPHQDHALAGDALSRFVSRRLEPGESPHEVWQNLQDADRRTPLRNAALPKRGFRSPPR